MVLKDEKNYSTVEAKYTVISRMPQVTCKVFYESVGAHDLPNNRNLWPRTKNCVSINVSFLLVTFDSQM